MNLQDPLEEDEMQKGFTVIELLIVIAIIAVIGATVSPFLSRFVLSNAIETTSNELVGSIKKAQENSMNSKDSSVWGVCFISNNIRIYRGSCVAPTYSEDFGKPASVSINGLQDTTFNLRGEPSNSLQITVSTDIDSVVVSLNEVGGVDVN
jgi:prepilin-type N-terminal cleavage/methylation domain-containing protein